MNLMKYIVEIVCQHVETRIINAKSKSDAMKKAERKEYEDVIDWHIDGNVFVQNIKKAN